MVGEIAEWMPECRQFPIENCDHPRFGRVHDHVVHAVVAVHQRSFVVPRHIGGQPSIQAIHVGNGFRLGYPIGFPPARELAREVIGRLAKIGEAKLFIIQTLQGGERADHRVVDRRALGDRHPGQGHLPQHAAFDHLHHIEHGADDADVFAQHEGSRHGKAGLMQCLDDAILAIDRMRRGQ